MRTRNAAQNAAQGWLFCLALCWAFVAHAQLAIPPLTARVTDTTGTLTADQKATLEQRLKDFEARKGSQIGVLLVPTTAPEAIEQYALRVAEQWKLGRKKIDDGALLIVAKDDRSMRIEVGYGLEGALNDATSKRIISEVITPYFKQADFYGGINAGLERMMRVVDGEPLPEPVRGQAGSSQDGVEGYLPIIFISVLVAGAILRAVFGRMAGALLTGGMAGVLAWFFIGALTIAALAGVLGFVFTLISGSGRGLRSSGFGGFGGGGFGGGGGGGGGFSGGGGGFGGGGASGKW